MKSILVKFFVIVFKCNLMFLFFCKGIVLGQSDSFGLPYTNNSFNSNAEINSRIKFPKSPEADALEKYGTTPVNLYSGTPEISIPLHTFKGREFELPIILNYDASGIKVSQIATNIGLGWNLSLGGRISRISNGKPDDIGRSPFFDQDNSDILDYLNNGITNFNSEQDLTNYLLFMKEVLDNHRDTLLDFYSINAIGINDYIVRDLQQPTIYHTLLNPRIIVIPLNDGWKIVVEDGTEYYFNGVKEQTEINHISTDNDNGIYSGTSTGSWLLTKIISKNKLDIFEFDYKNYSWNNFITSDISSKTYKKSFRNFVTYLEPVGIGYNFQESYKTTQMTPFTVKLNNELLVKFDYKSRNDLNLTTPCYQNGNALDKILFYNFKTPTESPSYFKKIEFKHDYFGNTDQETLPIHRRLKLQSLIFYNDNMLEGKKYSFDYDRPNLVPSISKNCQDFLGLNNGKNNNNLISTIYGENGEALSLNGADRKPYFDFMTIGTLNKITYTTKGFTTFEYEQNTIANNKLVPAYTADIQTEVLNYTHYNNVNCLGQIPDNFIAPHSSMQHLIFSSPSGYGYTFYNTNYTKTTLLNVEETKTHRIQTTGLGYFMIQKISGCDNPTIVQYPQCNEFYNYSTIENNYYPCLIPTTLQYVNRYGTNYSCSAENFIAGGYSYNNDLSLLLSSGTYQVTLWGIKVYSENETYFPQINVLIDKSVSTYFPEEIIYGTNKIEGFRIKNIKNFSSTEQLSSTKEYQYNEEINNNNNSTGFELSHKKNPLMSIYKVDPNCAIPNEEDITNLTMTSSNINTFPHVGYSSVFEIQKDSNNNIGYIQTKFNVGNTGITYSNDDICSFIPNFENGKIKEKNIYNKNWTIQRKENYYYETIDYYNQISFSFRSSLVKSFALANQSSNWALQTDLGFLKGCFPNIEGGLFNGPTGYFLTPNWTKNINYTPNWHSAEYGKYSYYPSTQKIYGQDGYLKKKEIFNYNSQGHENKEITEFNYELGKLQNKSTTKIDGTIVSEYYEYDPNFPYNPEKITDIHYFNNNKQIFHKNMKYSNYGTLASGIANFISEIKTAKGSNTLDSRLLFEYESSSKNIVNTHVPLSSTIENNVYESYIYGYNDMYPVAKLINVKYSYIGIDRINAIKAKSNKIITLANEQELLLELNKLRTDFPNAQIITYTYNPVVGVTSETDAKGDCKYYQYDELGRLKTVKDKNGNILSENEYRYRPQ